MNMMNTVTHVREYEGMCTLRRFFPTRSSVNQMNFVLFSTSGVSGSYTTIEEAEELMGTEEAPSVTFIIVQPRVCALTCGNCLPETNEDIVFLKILRRLSKKAIMEIG